MPGVGLVVKLVGWAVENKHEWTEDFRIRKIFLLIIISNQICYE